jgi:ABC-2 type transport system ATP-binding protein
MRISATYGPKGCPGPVVTVDHLRKTYGPGVGVQDVSFSVNRGEIFGIIGPNGAGKTTTVEAISGLRIPDSGMIRVLGLDPQADRAAVRERVGVQLQESALPPFIKVGEVLELFASFYRHPADPAELMDALGLAAKRGTYFMDEAERLCDRVLLIDQGMVTALDTPAGLAQSAGGGTHLRFVPSTSFDTRVLTLLPEVTEVSHEGQRIRVTGTGDLVGAVIRALEGADVQAQSMQVESATLDDAYVRLIHHDREEALRP